MEQLIAPKGIKTGIFDVLNQELTQDFEQGTPQGGSLAHFANIALNGIESIHGYKKYRWKE